VSGSDKNRLQGNFACMLVPQIHKSIEICHVREGAVNGMASLAGFEATAARGSKEWTS
jgi:hypothetical protein